MQPSAIPQFVLDVPERVARVPSGMLFAPTEAHAGEHGARFAQVAQFLQWLTPLKPISRDVQRFLGLYTPHVRSIPVEEAEVDAGAEPIAGVDEMEEEAEEEIGDEDEIEDEDEAEQERILRRLAVTLTDGVDHA